MPKIALVALTVAVVLVVQPVQAGDLARDKEYGNGVPDDWTGDDGFDSSTEEAVSPADEVYPPSPRRPLSRRPNRPWIIIEDRVTIGVQPQPYGWVFPSYPSCFCTYNRPASDAYLLGYSYGYALGTTAYGRGGYGGMERY